MPCSLLLHTARLGEEEHPIQQTFPTSSSTASIHTLSTPVVAISIAYHRVPSWQFQHFWHAVSCRPRAEAAKRMDDQS